MDSFLRVSFLFEVFRFKSVQSTRYSISRCKSGHLKQKEPKLLVAAVSSILKVNTAVGCYRCLKRALLLMFR
jgi:hypothetical protein